MWLNSKNTYNAVVASNNSADETHKVVLIETFIVLFYVDEKRNRLFNLEFNG